MANTRKLLPVCQLDLISSMTTMTAHSLFRNPSVIIDRFRCSDRMDYCQYRHRQSSSRTHVNDTEHSIVVKSQTYVRALGFRVPELETRQNNHHPTRHSSRFSIQTWIEAGTSFADQPRPRSLPSMSRQFVFVDYQWHRREWPR